MPVPSSFSEERLQSRWQEALASAAFREAGVDLAQLRASLIPACTRSPGRPAGHRAIAHGAPGGWHLQPGQPPLPDAAEPGQWPRALPGSRRPHFHSLAYAID